MDGIPRLVGCISGAYLEVSMSDGRIFRSWLEATLRGRGNVEYPSLFGWQSCRRGVRAGERHQDFESGSFPLKFCAVSYVMVKKGEVPVTRCCEQRPKV